MWAPAVGKRERGGGRPHGTDAASSGNSSSLISWSRRVSRRGLEGGHYSSGAAAGLVAGERHMQLTVREVESPGDRLVVQVDLRALAPEEVLDHWLRPELLTLWWPTEAETDPRPGGAYHLAWPAQGWHLRGRYTIVEPGSRVAFTWQWDHEPEKPLRHVEVAAVASAEGGTALTVTHAVYGDSAADREERESHRQGWEHFLGRLATLGR